MLCSISRRDVSATPSQGRRRFPPPPFQKHNLSQKLSSALPCRRHPYPCCPACCVTLSPRHPVLPPPAALTCTNGQVPSLSALQLFRSASSHEPPRVHTCMLQTRTTRPSGSLPLPSCASLLHRPLIRPGQPCLRHTCFPRTVPTVLEICCSPSPFAPASRCPEVHGRVVAGPAVAAQ